MLVKQCRLALHPFQFSRIWFFPVQLNEYETVPYFFNQAKTWHRIVCWFLCIYLFLPVLHDVIIKLLCRSKTKQFYHHIMQKLVKTGKTGKNTEINKQCDVKVWLNWIKYGAISYSLSCTYSIWHNLFAAFSRVVPLSSSIGWLFFTPNNNSTLLHSLVILPRSATANLSQARSNILPQKCLTGCFS